VDLDLDLDLRIVDLDLDFDFTVAGLVTSLLCTVEPFCRKTKVRDQSLFVCAVVGNPGEAVNILSLEPRSCNAEMVPPAE